MNSRKVRRGRGAGLGPGRRPRRSSGGGGKKGGACSFAVPVAAASLLLVAVQLLAVRWHARGAK